MNSAAGTESYGAANSGAADQTKSVQMRPFPYPYKAALAICNDLDGIRSFAEMKAIHDVLNGNRMTACGPGLGLEVSDSFHFFSMHPEQDDTLAYFDGLTPKPGAEATPLREGIQAGLLDIIHTWGNYSQKGGFFREQALWAAEELDKYGLRIPVWTNHGDRHNFQNLGRLDSLGDVREQTSRRGDRSQVLEYHADIARRIGIRYVWIKELTPLPGQERDLDWRDWFEQGSDVGKIFIKGMLGRDGHLNAGAPLQWSNRLIRPQRFRDGGECYEMLRYGDFRLDGSDCLPQLLTVKFLRRLVDVGGACLLYMHLGKGRPSPERPFSKESYQALERLAQWARSGEIWVTTASRLCRYVELRQRLKSTTHISSRKAQLSGTCTPAGELGPPDGAGLCFYLDADECTMTLDQAEPIAAIKNPPDFTGKVSFSIPQALLNYCWE